MNHASTFSLSEDVIHRKGWHDDDCFVPRIEIGRAKQMNTFIHPIREQNLRYIESEKISHVAFDRFALWIACQYFGIERAQFCQHPGRAADGALVEIETQALAPCQRRAVGMQIPDRGAGLKHGSTSPV